MAPTLGWIRFMMFADDFRLVITPSFSVSSYNVRMEKKETRWINKRATSRIWIDQKESNIAANRFGQIKPFWLTFFLFFCSARRSVISWRVALRTRDVSINKEIKETTLARRPPPSTPTQKNMNQSGAQQTNLCSKKVKGNDGRNFLFFSPNFFSLGQGRRSDPFVFPFLSLPRRFLVVVVDGALVSTREREEKSGSCESGQSCAPTEAKARGGLDTGARDSKIDWYIRGRYRGTVPVVVRSS